MSQRINLNTTPNQFMPILYFSQGDIGRTFEIALTSSDGYSIPIGATVEMVATKPSGFGFTVSGSLTGNVATFVTTETMTSEWGRFPAEIVIKNNGDVIGTANFYLNGERNPHPEGTIDGDASTIIPQLTLLVERVETAASSVLDRQTVTQTLPAGSQASYSFDEETNTQTFGIPQGEAGAGAVDVTASAYSSSKTYAVGDYVIHNDYLYRCTTAITTAEAWTSGHWTQVLLGDEVSDVKSDINYFGVLSYTVKKSNPNDNYPRAELKLVSGREYSVKLLRVDGDTNFRTMYIYQNGNYLASNLENEDVINFTPSGDYPVQLIMAYTNAPASNPTVVLGLAESANKNTVITLDALSSNYASVVNSYFGINGIKLKANSEYPRAELAVKSGQTYAIKLLNVSGSSGLQTIYVYQNTTLVSSLEDGERKTFTPTGNSPVYLIAKHSSTPTKTPTIIFALAEESDEDTIITFDKTVEKVATLDNVMEYHKTSSVTLKANSRYPRAEVPVVPEHEYYFRILNVDVTSGLETLYLNQGTSANTLVPDLEGGVLTKFKAPTSDKVYLQARYATDPSTLPTIIYELADVTELGSALSVYDSTSVVIEMVSNIKSTNHRGFNVQAPENTLPAFKLSKQYGYTNVETDVQFTSDGVAVLLHDLSINRTARNGDGSTISNTINISDITYEQALTYDFGIWKRNVYAGTNIPTFEEFISLCRNIGLRPYIELKTDVAYTQAQVESLVDIVKNYGMLDKSTWISFSSTLLGYVSNYESTARIGYLLDTFDSSDIAMAKSLGDNVFINAYYVTLTDGMVNLCIEANLPLEVWTVDDKSALESLNPYITGITSDNLIASVELYKSSI